MAAERSIIKATSAAQNTFDYKARELETRVSDAAQTFVDDQLRRSSGFKISDLVAQQSKISQLESDAHEGKINTQVMERLKSIEEKGYKEGYELGLLEGAERAFEEAKLDLVAKMKTFEALVKMVEQQRNDLLVDNESELIRMIYLIAKKMALRDLEENREAVLEILKTLVAEIQVDMQVVVRLASEDLYFLETLQDKNDQRLEFSKNVKLVASDDIQPGGCLVATEFGTVNATIEERLERTWQALQSRIPRKHPTGKGE